MASEDLFQNDYSEDPDLEQELQKTDEMNIDAVESDNDEPTEPNGPTTNSASENHPESTGNEPNKTTSNGEKPSDAEPEAKLTHLPMARIRNIMKLDPDLQIASNEAVFAVTRAVELFIESLARESVSYTAQSKKKTIQKRDVDLAISAVDSLMFLDGAMNF
ncbi:DNA polymerase epsilon subunit 4 [Drosophila innubila]|uniref:DNA polymerase epsilon subunit 4 n=1 Tax=Drosophila innubila TaxID=198719 RepID=UPI00148DA373|nr:DNA polymerase epsilon subunit 4 [Drosophila innubila]